MYGNKILDLGFIQIPIIIAIGLVVIVGGVIYRGATNKITSMSVSDGIGIVSSTSSTTTIPGSKGSKTVSPNSDKATTSTSVSVMKKPSLFSRLINGKDQSSIKVVDPKNQRWEYGTNQEIKWKKVNSTENFVTIWLLPKGSGSRYLLGSKILNSGSFKWLVDVAGQETGQANQFSDTVVGPGSYDVCVCDKVEDDLCQKSCGSVTIFGEPKYREDARSSSELGVEFVMGLSGGGSFEESVKIFIPGGLTEDSVLRLEGGDYECDFIVMATDPIRDDFIGDTVYDGGWRIWQKNGTFPGFADEGWEISGWIGGVNCHGSISKTRVFKEGIYRILLLKNGKVVAKSLPLNMSWQSKAAEAVKMQMSVDSPVTRIDNKINLHLEVADKSWSPKEVQYSVNWGDGTSPDSHPNSGVVGGGGIKADFSHYYSNPGSYTVRANLDFSTFGKGQLSFQENVIVDVRGYDPSCTDSDGGSNPLVRGVMNTVDARGNTFQSDDWCDSRTPDYLDEGTCVDNVINFNKIFCSAGCVEGACVPE